MALYVPGTEETDPKKIIMSQQLVAGQTTTNTTAIATNTTNIATNTTNIATNTAAIAALNAATYVNSINSRTGAITLNSTSGITNSSNDIILSQASSSQFGAVKVDNTTITASSGVISAVIPSAQTTARAWVQFNGTGTVAINSSFNVSSITDNGTGDYTVNFTSSISDALYLVIGSAYVATADTTRVGIVGPKTLATGSVRVLTGSSGTASAVPIDCVHVSVGVFR
jgi:hypothetical protein